MSSSDQVANNLRPFTTTRLRELLEGQLEGIREGNLHGLVLRLRNSDEQPLTQGAASGGAVSPSRPITFSAVQNALATQARSTATSRAPVSGQPLPQDAELPSAAQLELARTLLRRHSMLHLAELQLEIALGSLQRHDVHNHGALQTAALDEARTALVADIDRARRAVEDERRRLDDARGEAERLFPNIDFS
ncbi:MAG: hypothetical protein ACRC9R_08770, partial [Enterovibrio sp.]